MTLKYEFDKGFTIDFDLLTGFSKMGESTKRKLSDMKGMYRNEADYENLSKEENPLIYEFYELGAPHNKGDLAFGTSITYPGKVGNEYFMTKGHFHTELETAEVYYCLSGLGYMMMENPEGDWKVEELTPGKVIYVPKCYAHRSINIGNTPFVTFFVFRADAGHDYMTIETKGFRHLVVEKDGKPEIISNSKW